jgi:hypothetical protein
MELFLFEFSIDVIDDCLSWVGLETIFWLGFSMLSEVLVHVNKNTGVGNSREVIVFILNVFLRDIVSNKVVDFLLDLLIIFF